MLEGQGAFKGLLDEVLKEAHFAMELVKRVLEGLPAQILPDLLSAKTLFSKHECLLLPDQSDPESIESCIGEPLNR